MRLSERMWDAIAPYDCLGCGSEGRLVCDSCWSLLFIAPPHSTTAYALTIYSNLAKALVHSMKVGCCRQASKLIARALAERAPPVPTEVIVTAVPTADARRRERGFDHGADIAHEFARLRNLQYRRLLVRHGRAKQAGASASMRERQVRGVFEASRLAAIENRHIAIVDDVITTGSTISEAISVLQKNKAASVMALVFAQAMYRPGGEGGIRTHGTR